MRSKILEERVRRVRVLFRELGYKLATDEQVVDEYAAAFSNHGGVYGGVFLDGESRFLELGYTFSFSPAMSHYLRSRLEEMMRICYEYGCYPNIQKETGEIAFSLFSKIYFSGLNYYSLRDSLKDFRACVKHVTALLDIQTETEEGEQL